MWKQKLEAVKICQKTDAFRKNELKADTEAINFAWSWKQKILRVGEQSELGSVNTSTGFESGNIKN